MTIEQVLGDTDSAIIFFVDEPVLFGNEARLLTAVNFRDKKRRCPPRSPVRTSSVPASCSPRTPPWRT